MLSDFTMHFDESLKVQSRVDEPVKKDCQKASFIKDRKKQSSRLNLKEYISSRKKYLGTLNESLCTLRTYALQHSEVVLEENGKLPVNNAFKNARQYI